MQSASYYLTFCANLFHDLKDIHLTEVITTSVEGLFRTLSNIYDKAPLRK